MSLMSCTSLSSWLKDLNFEHVYTAQNPPHSLKLEVDIYVVNNPVIMKSCGVDGDKSGDGYVLYQTSKLFIDMNFLKPQYCTVLNVERFV